MKQALIAGNEIEKTGYDLESELSKILFNTNMLTSAIGGSAIFGQLGGSIIDGAFSEFGTRTTEQAYQAHAIVSVKALGKLLRDFFLDEQDKDKMTRAEWHKYFRKST